MPANPSAPRLAATAGASTPSESGSASEAIVRGLAAAPAELTPSAVPDVLARLRGEIEALDREIIMLIGRRVGVAREVGRVKRAAGLPVADPAREREVLGQAREQARAAGLPYAALRGLMQRVITLARRAQEQDADSHPDEDLNDQLHAP